MSNVSSESQSDSTINPTPAESDIGYTEKDIKRSEFTFESVLQVIGGFFLLFNSYIGDMLYS
jgi:hypothetical protein